MDVDLDGRMDGWIMDDVEVMGVTSIVLWPLPRRINRQQLRGGGTGGREIGQRTGKGRKWQEMAVPLPSTKQPTNSHRPLPGRHSAHEHASSSLLFVATTTTSHPSRLSPDGGCRNMQQTEDDIICMRSVAVAGSLARARRARVSLSKPPPSDSACLA